MKKLCPRYFFTLVIIALMVTAVINPRISLGGEIYGSNEVLQKTMAQLDACDPSSIEVFENEYVEGNTIYKYILILQNTSYNINISGVYIVYNSSSMPKLIDEKSIHIQNISLNNAIIGYLVTLNVNRGERPLYTIVNITLSDQCSILRVIPFNLELADSIELLDNKLQEINKSIENIIDSKLQEIKSNITNNITTELQDIRNSMKSFNETLREIGNSVNLTSQYSEINSKLQEIKDMTTNQQSWAQKFDIVIIAILALNTALTSYLVYVFTKSMKTRYELLE